MLELKVDVPPLEGLLTLTAPQQRDVAEQAAIGMRNAIGDNFDRLPGTRYWKQARARTRVEDDADGFAVVVRQRGVALQLYGGTVEPGKSMSTHTKQPTKLLAIPAAKSIREAPNAYKPLVFVGAKAGNMRGMLLPGEVRPAKRAYKGLPAGRLILAPVKGADPLFLLVQRTQHAPHPEVMPSNDELANVAAEYAAEEIKRIMTP